MAGAFDWLDTLANQIGVVGGKAVDAAANLATIKATAGASEPDQTAVPATSPLQTLVAGGGWVPWALGGVVVAGLLYLAVRAAK